MTYPKFSEVIAAKYGAKWCVAPRRTPRLAARYGVVITPKAYARERDEWVSGHPAIQALSVLPEGEHSAFIRTAVQRELAASA